MHIKEFTTFKNLENSFTIDTLKKDSPSNINFLEYRKYKVSVELIDEPKDVLIKRLNDLLIETKGYHKKKRIKDEIEKLNK